MSENIREMYKDRFKGIEQEVTAINKARADLGRAFTDLVKKIDNLGAKEMAQPENKTFKRGDIVENVAYKIIVEGMTSETHFAGTILSSSAGTRLKEGYRSVNWVAGVFDLVITDE